MKEENKNIKYCPSCDKYCSVFTPICPFCGKNTVFLNQWNKMADTEKEDYIQNTKEADTFWMRNGDSLAQEQADVDAFDTQYRKQQSALKTRKTTLNPICPKCKSDFVSEFQSASKDEPISITPYGVSYTKVKKSFHCCNCGYEW